MYRSASRRALFILISIIMPIIANGFRALGIVVLGRILGSAQAAGADHLIYGWIFFSFVILLLVLFGLPFREDTRPSGPAPVPASPAPAGAGRLAILSSALLVGLAAVGPVAVAEIDRSAATAPVPHLAGLTPDPGCELVTGGPGITPVSTANGLTQYFRCEGYTVAVRMEIFSPRTGAGRLLKTQQRQIAELGTGDTLTSWLTVPGTAPRIWRLTEMEEGANLAVSAVWIDGKPTQISLANRLKLAQRSLFGSTSTPMLVMITPAGDWRDTTVQYRAQAHATIEAFFRNEKTLEQQLAKLSGGSPGP